MSLRTTVRAWPTLLKIGFQEAVAYRAEFLVWVLATTMPLIMLALWTAVARDAPVGRFGQEDFTAYFLATFIVRQLTGAWAAWQMNYEVRQGTLAMRLLRPINPVASYAAENLAAVPLRMLIAAPVAVVSLMLVGTERLPTSPAIWGVWLLAMLGAWLITFLTNVAVGCLALFMESSQKLMDVYLVLFFVFSGYMIPVDLFPGALRAAAEWLPFRYQIGFPVELMTGAHGTREALAMLARQWIWVFLIGGLGAVLWKRGLRRFAAYGG
jgi:ABC-2 type transport system permease protein